MFSEAITWTQRRLQIKFRAKSILRAVYFRLLLVLAIYQVPMLVLSDLISRIDFGGPTVEILGIPVSLVGEAARFIMLFLEAPLLLGASAYMLRLDEQRPLRVGSVFSWFSDGRRLTQAANYALFSVALQLVLYPLDRLPQLWLNSRAEEYAGVLQQMMETTGSGGLPDAELLRQGLAISGQSMLCTGLSVCFMLVMMLFAPLAYLVAMDPEGQTGFFAKLKENFRCIRGHYFEFLVFTLSFIGWYLLASLLSQFGRILIYPYIYMAQAVFFNRLIRAKRGLPDPGAAPSEGESDPEQNQEKERER